MINQQVVRVIPGVAVSRATGREPVPCGGTWRDGEDGGALLVVDVRG